MKRGHSLHRKNKKKKKKRNTLHYIIHAVRADVASSYRELSRLFCEGNSGCLCPELIGRPIGLTAFARPHTLSTGWNFLPSPLYIYSFLLFLPSSLIFFFSLPIVQGLFPFVICRIHYIRRSTDNKYFANTREENPFLFLKLFFPSGFGFPKLRRRCNVYNTTLRRTPTFRVLFLTFSNAITHFLLLEASEF